MADLCLTNFLKENYKNDHLKPLMLNYRSHTYKFTSVNPQNSSSNPTRACTRCIGRTDAGMIYNDDDWCKACMKRMDLKQEIIFTK